MKVETLRCPVRLFVIILLINPSLVVEAAPVANGLSHAQSRKREIEGLTDSEERKKRGWLFGNGSQNGNGCFGLVGIVGKILGNTKGCQSQDTVTVIGANGGTILPPGYGGMIRPPGPPLPFGGGGYGAPASYPSYPAPAPEAQTFGYQPPPPPPPPAPEVQAYGAPDPIPEIFVSNVSDPEPGADPAAEAISPDLMQQLQHGYGK